MGLPARTMLTADPADGHRALIDRVPVGLMWLGEGGAPLRWNDQAEAFLRTPTGPRLQETIERLRQACGATQTCVQTQFELSKTERLHVAVAPDAVAGHFMVVLDRQKLEKARAEASVLRAVLKAVGGSVSRHDAVRRALEAVRASLPLAQLAFFELDSLGQQLSCTAWAGLSTHEAAAIGPVSANPADNLVAIALKHRRTVHVSDVAKAPAKLPFVAQDGLAVVLLPLGARGPRGVLYVSAMPDVLNEGGLRLVQALGDAIAALLDLASLEAEAARAREIASQRDRLATIGQLVAGVAHEINNPLAFLKSNLHSLKQEVDDLRERNNASQLGEVDDIVSESLDGVQRIEALVQALKGTARQRNEKVRFDPARAVNEAVTIFRGAKKSECEIACDIGSLPEVLGSPSALGQVVLNLLQNGLDAMSALERHRRKIEISAKAEGSVVYLTVRDHGTGIPPQVQERMYDAFFTTKEVGKGTGLGLYICKEIVEAMGGHMEFTSGPEGTIFHLIVPCADSINDAKSNE